MESERKSRESERRKAQRQIRKQKDQVLLDLYFPMYVLFL